MIEKGEKKIENLINSHIKRGNIKGAMREIIEFLTHLFA